MNVLIYFFKVLFVMFSGLALYGAMNHIWLVAFTFTLLSGFVADLLYLNHYIDNHNYLPKFTFTFPITLTSYTLMTFTAFVIMVMNGVISLIFLTAVAFMLGLVLLFFTQRHLFSKKELID